MLVWIGFISLIGVFLALDLGVFNKDPHKISTKEALRWTALWVSMSLLFSIFIYYAYENNWFGIGKTIGLHSTGWDAAITYLTGYIVEQSLSLDNVFVIAVIFSYFHIPMKYQHRVLFWGIIGALFFRGLMIGAGAILVQQFDWIMYLFGLILLWTAYKMLKSDDEQIHPENNPVVLQLRKILPVTKSIRREHFFVKWKGRTIAMTPLFVALVVVETTDIMFAFDSIPAIFSITKDPFIVFTSNIFAILGLRSLYFVLASMLDKFQYVKYSLVIILTFVGIKMLVFHPLHIVLPEWVSLAFIVLVLGSGIFFSMWKDKQE
ncbi:MAG: TerC family protein [Saprospiraceae bacterium]|nr:TerC family protein [Saprospiraceae bacterium]MCF8251097.1 TerC family protein [Saprospiraceae bacterium]MCF8280999.1 TerC family protein [Bacteroidales bacterium]MCF8312945.1 TerC family protein [Saprospiraceae bacterium]MCF8441356.1 TerC family protein [Saprospiraceae bacterium]